VDGYLGYAVLPFVPRLAAQMVNRSGHQLDGSPIKTAGSAAAESHRRRYPKRNADDVFAYGAIPVPTDPGTRIISDQQGLNEVIGFETCKPPGAIAQRTQPIRDRFRRSEARRIEIVVPAERGGQALSQSSVESER
jgi:hypothetical protein